MNLRSIVCGQLPNSIQNFGAMYSKKFEYRLRAALIAQDVNHLIACFVPFDDAILQYVIFGCVKRQPGQAEMIVADWYLQNNVHRCPDRLYANP